VLKILYLFAQMILLKEAGYRVTPIFSQNAYETDTRFGAAKDWIQKAQEITGESVIHTIAQAEPIGPKKLLDLLIIAPCTGNTLGKLAAGIYDTAPTLAFKSHRRNGRPVLIAVSTNDALAASAPAIAMLENRKGIYFVPYEQDDFGGKPCSCVADFTQILPAAQAAMEGRQLQPILL
jgi:dipicolinate synthase subunit B